LTWEEDKKLPIFTTLFQNAFGESIVDDEVTNPLQTGTPADEPCWADGKKLDGFPQETVLPSNTAHWVVDNKKTGYYIHDGNDALRLVRRPQEWTYCHRGTFVKKSVGDYMKVLHNKAGDWNPENYETTKGDFALGYFEHGATPTAARCAYTLMPSSSPGAMEAFATSMKNTDAAPYRILQQDAKAHILWDRESETTGYVIFNSTWTSPSPTSNPCLPTGKIRSPILQSVNRPCYVMVRATDSRLTLSAACTDKNRWGILTKRLHTEPDMCQRQEPTAEDRAAVIELTLAGAWRLSADAPTGCTAVQKDGVTVVKIPYDNFLPIRFTLEQ